MSGTKVVITTDDCIPLAYRELLSRWLRREGFPPEDCYRVEANGVQCRVFRYLRDENGCFFWDDARDGAADEAVDFTATKPPPLPEWIARCLSSSEDGSSIPSTEQEVSD